MSPFRALCATLVVASLLCWHVEAKSQTAPNRYWVQFGGKLAEELPAGHSTPYTLDAPTEFLSTKAIYRRALQNIGITAHDRPSPILHRHPSGHGWIQGDPPKQVVQCRDDRRD